MSEFADLCLHDHTRGALVAVMLEHVRVHVMHETFFFFFFKHSSVHILLNY